MAGGVVRGVCWQKRLSAGLLLLLVVCETCDARTTFTDMKEPNQRDDNDVDSREDLKESFPRSLPSSYKVVYTMSLIGMLLVIACLAGCKNRCCSKGIVVERRPVVLMLLRTTEREDLPGRGYCVEDDAPPPYCEVQAEDLPPSYSEVCKGFPPQTV